MEGSPQAERRCQAAIIPAEAKIQQIIDAEMSLSGETFKIHPILPSLPARLFDQFGLQMYPTPRVWPSLSKAFLGLNFLSSRHVRQTTPITVLIKIISQCNLNNDRQFKLRTYPGQTFFDLCQVNQLQVPAGARVITIQPSMQIMDWMHR